MATIICMDGLGGHPEITFGELKVHLESAGHRVVLADVEGIKTHADRIDRVLAACKGIPKGEHVFLLGQSAGGGAVRRAACRRDVKGVVLLSQSMPRYCLYLTPQLLLTMIGRIKDLILGRPITSTAAEYRRIITPVAEEFEQMLVDSRRTLPGKETREMAFNPPEVEHLSCPALIIYGEVDRWISPRAHKKLCLDLRRKSTSEVHEYQVFGAGHLTLASDSRKEVFQKITSWIQNLSR